MTSKKLPVIEIADDTRIQAHDVLALDFFTHVLKMNFQECLVTDISNLSDFCPRGLDGEFPPDATYQEICRLWDATVLPRISVRYHIDTPRPNVLLVDLFDQIKAKTSIPN